MSPPSLDFNERRDGRAVGAEVFAEHHAPEARLERPLLFLDVDGVLNCFREEPVTRYETEGGPVFVRDGCAERVRRLVDAFECVWATAWLGSAHRVWSRLLGLDPPPWPYVDFVDLKVTEILRMAKGRPWAWVDDDAGWELGKLGVDGFDNSLIIVPDPNLGLTDEHVVALLAFAHEPLSEHLVGPHAAHQGHARSNPKKVSGS